MERSFAYYSPITNLLKSYGLIYIYANVREQSKITQGEKDRGMSQTRCAYLHLCLLMKFSQGLLFDLDVSVCHSTLCTVIKPLAHTHKREHQEREASSFINAVL